MPREVTNSILKQLLRQKNKTCQWLADETGIKKTTLDPYMADRSSFQKAEAWLVLRVADALDCDPHVLIDYVPKRKVKKKRTVSNGKK